MSEVKSVARGLAVLEKLAEAPDGLGITELAGQFGVDKGSMSRLLQTLARYGYAEKHAVSRRYVLGPEVVRLSRVVLARMPLRETAKPYLKQLVNGTGECAHLAIYALGQALYIDQVDSPSALRVMTAVGTLGPLHCTALGKVLLAFAGAPIPERLDAHTARTIVDPVLLGHHLQAVRAQGYAVDDEEHVPGVRCIAVPVFDFREKCVAAIGISGPSTRVTLEGLPAMARVVQEAGRSLSARLSFREGPPGK